MGGRELETCEECGQVDWPWGGCGCDDLPMITGREPKYLLLADALRRRIRSGEYPVGEQMPTEATLSEEFGVSVPTVRQTMSVLREEGLAETRHGIGTFVREPAPVDGDLREALRIALEDELGGPVGEHIVAALLPIIAAHVRAEKAEVWDEGFEAGATWQPSGPSGIPSDPPLNPYQNEGK